MKTIWNFQLGSGSTQTVEMPVGARIVAVGMKRSKVTIWAEVDSEAETEERRFRVYGTGHSIEDGWEYVGTCFDGPFAWHVYEG